MRIAQKDNPTNQLVLKTLLHQVGIQPVLVANGLQAVDAWESGDFDVILMDVQMPDLDGPGATRLIRRKEADTGRRRTPILGLTANAMSHQIEAYRAAGIDWSSPSRSTLRSFSRRWNGGAARSTPSEPARRGRINRGEAGAGFRRIAFSGDLRAAGVVLDHAQGASRRPRATGLQGENRRPSTARPEYLVAALERAAGDPGLGEQTKVTPRDCIGCTAV